MNQDQNNAPPPADDDAGEEGSITLSLAQYQSEMAKARKSGERRAANRAGAPASPSGGSRLDKLEGAVSMMASIMERLAPSAAPAQTAPAPTVAPTTPPPAAAPSAPVPHALPTAMGMVDIWNMTATQIDQAGPSGIRAEFEKHLEVGRRSKGAPPQPQPPNSVRAMQRDIALIQGHMGIKPR